MQHYNNPGLIRTAQEMPRRIGIIGTGTIGPDIGYYLKSALPDLNLVLIDINREALDRAIDRLHAYAQKGLARGKLTPAQAGNVRRNLSASLDYEALDGCDWVIEAATENLELKKTDLRQGGGHHRRTLHDHLEYQFHSRTLVVLPPAPS